MRALGCALLALGFSGCVWTTEPSPPPVPPPDGPGTCETSAATLTKLGGCGEDLDGWEGRCRDADRSDQQVGLRLPNGCWTASTSCREFLACR